MSQTVPVTLSPIARQRLATVLFVVASAGLVAGVVATWARWYPLDTDRFAAAAERALDEPEVVEKIAAVATDQLVDLVLAVSDPRQVLPEPLQGIGSGPERLVRGFLSDQMARLVATDTGRRVVVAAVRVAHAEVVTVVEHGRSERGLLTVDENIVRLDLTGVLAAGLDALAERGLAPGAVGGLQESLRGGLEGLQTWVLGVSGIDIGEQPGTVVVYDASAVDRGGLALRSARWSSGGRMPAAGWFAVALVAAGAAAAVSTDRRRGLQTFGVALGASALLAHLYWRRVASDVYDLLDDPAVRDAATAITDELSRPLSAALLVTALVGLGTAVAVASSARRKRAGQPVGG
jgi:hypothetical protein